MQIVYLEERDILNFEDTEKWMKDQRGDREEDDKESRSRRGRTRTGLDSKLSKII